jgi:uncharacterized protein YhbP (UPF0306 family)
MTIAMAENGWVNTTETHDPEVIRNAQRILDQTLYCTLSTCSADGFPWASPLYFSYDRHWHLYWSSAIASQHSQNLDKNGGRAAITLYNTARDQPKVQGLFLTGLAHELDPNRVASVLKTFFDRYPKAVPQRTAADYLHDSPRRIYHFVPQAVWITGERLAVGNQLVDTKIQLDLLDLIHSDFTRSDFTKLGG